MSSASSTKPDVSAGSNNTQAAPSATTSSNNSSSNNNAEQPQTKRQKIEKIKSNSKNGNANKSTSPPATGATRTKTPPPDIIERGVISMLDTPLNGNNGQQHRCSSLSSSANSISTPSSSNNSPTSTPSSSRTTSLTQLLNVQTGVNVLPQGTASSVTKFVKTSLNSASAQNTIPDTNSAASLCGSTASSNTDEVDRVGVNIPDLLPSVSSVKFSQSHPETAMVVAHEDMREFEASLTKQCLCGVSERTLRKPFQSHYSVDANGQKRIANLAEWPTEKLLQFLSNLQLLFDIYLKQNSKGFICARIMDVCDVLIRNENNLIDEIIVLAGYDNTYVQFLAGRVLASFLVIAKQDIDDNWLKKLVDNLFNFNRLDHIAVQKIHFSLEIIKRIVEWKDLDLHPLEDEIVDSQTGNMIHMSSAGGDGLEAHSYLHFQQQQPTLETNYFAVQFRDSNNENEDVNSDEIVIENDEEQNVGHVNSAQNHARRAHHHNTSQIDQTFDAYTLHGTAIQRNEFLPTLNYSHSPHASHSAHVDPLFASAHPHAYHHHHAHAQTHFNTLPHFNNSRPISPATMSSVAADPESGISAGPTAALLSSTCQIITLTDSESFDTTHLKGITIKILENKWPALVGNMSALIDSHMDIDNAENCILNFLQLWENIISVKANLSVVETRPFYAQLDKFERLLNQQHLSCTVYKQMLCLFNEALCYGSTLALQDMLPDETCELAHQIVRHVKDERILHSMPRRQPENAVSLLGFKQRPLIYAEGSLQSQAQDQMHSPVHHSIVSSSAPHYQHTHSLIAGGDDVIIEMDKTILQKMVLLVLKSIAVTVKEIRSDSSDSSIDSRDYDAYQEMVVIERSIRDVLRKLKSFITDTLEFHPEWHFSKILIHLFEDQDDHLIEAMVCTLDVTAGISFRNNAFRDLVKMLNPAFTFLEFLKMISNSLGLLLDFLVSNETCFLLYLLRFLKYIRANWDMFVDSCQEFGGANTLDEAMTVLIRLRLHISRLVAQQLYPYDISPVLRLLESCEGLYEGNDSSLT